MTRFARPFARLAASISVFALLLIVPASIRGDDNGLEVLAGVLTRLEAQESGAVEAFAPDTGADDATLELMPFVETFAQRDAEQRHAFDVAAAKGLSGKAAERLTAARTAWANGQGRLVGILQRLAIAPTGKKPTDRTSRATTRIDLIQEARQIVEKLQDASRNDPISAGELKIRAPRIQAPPLVVGESKRPDRTALAPGATAERAATVPGVDDVPIGYVPGVLQDAAASFSGPIEVYEFVRNNVRPEFYHGGMKGALQTYLEGSGNDADTAAVLIALMRAKGYPARFVRGTVEIPASTLTAITGTVSVEEAVRVLERAAIPHETVLGAGAVSSVKLERVWAEAYLPYANYRGAVLDSQGKCWVPLDAGFKRLEPVSGIDVVHDLGFDPRAVMDEYLASSDTRRPLELVKAKVAELLAQQQPDKTYNDVLNSRGIVPETLGALPASLPYPVVDRTEVTYALPETLTHSVRIVGEAGGTTILDATFPVSDLLGRRLTLSYVPDSAEDQDLVTSYGGLYWTPPYLIDVRPVLKSGGVPIATGAVPVGMGVKYTLRMEFKTAGGTETVENTVLAGNMLAIGLGGRQVTGTETETDTAAAILSARAWGYLDRWNRSDEELADLFRVVPVRPTVSECMTMSDIEVEYAGGDPLYPIRYEWKGIAIDADLRSTAPVGLASRDSERPFVLLSGLEGSVLENKIFEEDLQIASVSTAKALQLAKAQGIEILDVNQGNVDSVLPGLPLDSAVKAEIRDATSRGFLARVPAANATYMAWTGVGYLLLDEETGEAAYQLQGGHSGGVTAPAVIEIPESIMFQLEGQDEKPAEGGTEVARIQKFYSIDNQFGFVDTSQDLQRNALRPLKVLVTDANGHPVPKAAVTFKVIGGGGFVISQDPNSTVAVEGMQVVAFSDDRGEASVKLKLGKKTDLIPRYVAFAGDEYATQVGLNMVSAIAGAAVLPEPIFAFGFPDDTYNGQSGQALFRLTEHTQWWGWANLRFAGRYTVSAEDKHGNPIANVPVAFHALHPPTAATPPDGWTSIRDVKTDGPRAMSELVGVWDFEKCRAAEPIPKWGTCEGRTQTINAKTFSVGYASAYAFLGESSYSRYYFEMDAGSTPGMYKDYFSTGGWFCEGTSCVDYYGLPLGPVVTADSRLVLLNRLGNAIEAYPPNGTGELSFSANVLWEKDRIELKDGIYYARGTNEWVRENLADSEFALAATSPGTTISPKVAVYDGKSYVSSMKMSATPQLNKLDWKSTHHPKVIKYINDGFDGAVAEGDLLPDKSAAIRRADPARPVIIAGGFALWGARVEITGVEPPLVLLNHDHTVLKDTMVSYRIDPSDYAGLTDPLAVRLDLMQGAKAVVSARGGDGTPFVVPKGLKLDPGTYQGRITIESVSKDGTDLESEPFPIHALIVDLVADTNRDGGITDADEAGKADWTKDRGAIFSVNLDRDGDRTEDGVPVPDAVDFGDNPVDIKQDGLPFREDFRIDKDPDALDITPMVLRKCGAPLPPGVRVFLAVPEQEDIQSVHVFKKIAAEEESVWGSLGDRVQGGTPEPMEKDVTYLVDSASPTFAGAVQDDDRLGIKKGDVVFGIEGMFFRNLGDRNHFDGDVDFTVEFRKDGRVLGSDSVRLKVAPWIMLPSTAASTEIWASDIGSANASFVQGLSSDQLHLVPPDGSGQFLQDHIETGYYQRPGGPKTLATFRLPSRKLDDNNNVLPQPKWPVLNLLRSDAATFQYGVNLGLDNGSPYSYEGSYGGNVELLPPTQAYALGRVVTGDTRSDALRQFLESQEVQPPLDLNAEVPTRWLAVGHVDEIVAFLPTPGHVAMADPAYAYQLMREMIERIPEKQRGQAVFFAKGDLLPQAGTVSAPPLAPNLLQIEPEVDLTGQAWKYVRIYRDIGSGAAGQVASIAPGGLGKGFLMIDKVWNVGSKVVPSIASWSSVYINSILGLLETPTSPEWFVAPRTGDRYVLVEDAQKWLDGTPAIITVEEVLKDKDLEDLNTTDARNQIAVARDRLQAAAGGGLSFISVPVIYVGARTDVFVTKELAGPFEQRRSAIAYTPGLANLQAAAGSLYFPSQFGPRGAEGKDLFEMTTQSRLPAARFVDDWNVYHRWDGEVHCGTTVVRKPFDFDWWKRQP